MFLKACGKLFKMILSYYSVGKYKPLLAVYTTTYPEYCIVVSIIFR
jgi:hypothetical protein